MKFAIIITFMTIKIYFAAIKINASCSILMVISNYYFLYFYLKRYGFLQSLFRLAMSEKIICQVNIWVWNVTILQTFSLSFSTMFKLNWNQTYYKDRNVKLLLAFLKKDVLWPEKGTICQAQKWGGKWRLWA